MKLTRRYRTRFCYFSKAYLGDPAGFTVTGGLVAAGPAAGACVGACVGALPAAAGRNPRLPGLFSMFAARWLTILASFIADSNKAALRIALRWLVSPCVICWRTPALSRVRFSFASRFSASLKMYHLPLLKRVGCV